jgi:putative ABC transport system permease protein
MDFLQSLLNGLPGSVGQGLMWGIMAIGVYITYRVLDIADLTVDGSLATGGAVCVLLTVNGVNIWLAVLIAMLTGMLAGLVTGLFHTRCGIPAILAGILTQLALYSINLRIMGWGSTAGTQSTLAVSVDKFDLLVSSRYVRELALNNPILLLAALSAVVVGLLYWFFGTEIGCGIRATGANRNMARAQGINTERNAVIGLMLSNGIVALAGALIAQYQGSSTVDMGRGAIVIGLAAVIIGEVILGSKVNNFAVKLASCLLGAIIYYVVIQVVLRLGLNTNDLKLLTALIVALFLAIPYWRDKLLKGAGAKRKSVKEETGNA